MQVAAEPGPRTRYSSCVEDLFLALRRQRQLLDAFRFSFPSQMYLRTGRLCGPIYVSFNRLDWIGAVVSAKERASLPSVGASDTNRKPIQLLLSSNSLNRLIIEFNSMYQTGFKRLKE